MSGAFLCEILSVYRTSGGVVSSNDCHVVGIVICHTGDLCTRKEYIYFSRYQIKCVSCTGLFYTLIYLDF